VTTSPENDRIVVEVRQPFVDAGNARDSFNLWEESIMKDRTQLLLVLGTLILCGCVAFAQQKIDKTVEITKGPLVEHTGSTDAVIAWSTSASSSTDVMYGTDKHNLDKKASAPWGGLTHRVTLKNLEPGKTYYYQVTSENALGSGSAASGPIGQFTTKGSDSASNSTENSANPSDNHQDADKAKNDFRITNGPVVEKVGESNATVAWSTDRPSSSVVKYGTDRNNMDQTAQMPWGATTHRVELKNLKPGTQYYFTVHSAQGKNAPGQKEDSEPMPFTTKAAGQQASNADNDQDKNEFRITNGPVIEHVGDNRAVIAWSTNRDSTSVIKYGTDKNNLSQTAEAGRGRNIHRVELKNLKPDTQYYFQVQSAEKTNAPDQGVKSEATNFHTAAAGQSASAPKQ
jgi:phosphodiesterase/alkaline phosphatase D-like protein